MTGTMAPAGMPAKVTAAVPLAGRTATSPVLPTYTATGVLNVSVSDAVMGAALDGYCGMPTPNVDGLA
jgi:hypothetical protein